MHLKTLIIMVGFIVLTIISCATTKKTMTFKAEKRASVSLVTFNALDQDGEKIGETPVSVDMTKLKGKAVKIAATGKQSQVWVFPDTIGSKTEAFVKFLDSETKDSPNRNSEEASKSTANKAFRLLLKAYQSLSSKDYAATKGLCDQASEIDPSLSAPFIIKGLALMQEGDKEGARLSLTKAKGLDPEDNNIEELLKATW